MHVNSLTLLQEAMYSQVIIIRRVDQINIPRKYQSKLTCQCLSLGMSDASGHFQLELIRRTFDSEILNSQSLS